MRVRGKGRGRRARGGDEGERSKGSPGGGLPKARPKFLAANAPPKRKFQRQAPADRLAPNQSAGLNICCDSRELIFPFGEHLERLRNKFVALCARLGLQRTPRKRKNSSIEPIVGENLAGRLVVLSLALCASQKKGGNESQWSDSVPVISADSSRGNHGPVSRTSNARLICCDRSVSPWAASGCQILSCCSQPSLTSTSDGSSSRAARSSPRTAYRLSGSFGTKRGVSAGRGWG